MDVHGHEIKLECLDQVKAAGHAGRVADRLKVGLPSHVAPDHLSDLLLIIDHDYSQRFGLQRHGVWGDARSHRHTEAPLRQVGSPAVLAGWPAVRVRSSDLGGGRSRRPACARRRTL